MTKHNVLHTNYRIGVALLLLFSDFRIPEENNDFETVVRGS